MTKHYLVPLEAKIERMYLSGMSLNAIARELKSRFQSIHKALVRRGVTLRSRANKGSANGKWRGGRECDKGGYALTHRPDHPLATKAGYVREHRLVAEQSLGRYLTATEVVHHRDEDPGNNAPDNLIVFETNGKHLAATRKGRVPRWTADGKRRILEAVRKPQKRAASLPASVRGDDQSPQKTCRSTAKRGTKTASP